MEFSYTKGPVSDLDRDVLVVPLYADDGPTRAPLREVDKMLSGRVASAFEAGELRGKRFEATLWPVRGDGPRNVLFVGAGDRGDADADVMRRVFAVAARRLRDRYASAALLLRSVAHAQGAVEGLLWGAYEPDLHKAERVEVRLADVALIIGRNVQKPIAVGRAAARGTNLARDLVNEPANHMTPSRLAERAKETLEPLGVKVEVKTGKDLSRFGGLLGVAQGSAEPPALISMVWEPSRAPKTTVLGLVGKGVTFDSGGLSLKPSAGMEWMKGDMAGAAAVIGAMQAIASLNLPVRVRAVVPATENMPSGTATRVGDVLTFYSGKTAEIMNTDAEGRLILHDALAWIAEQGATHVVDAATLTGAVMVALGNVTFGVMGRPDDWVNRVCASARRAGEKAWPLPLYPDYREQLRSDLADMKNVGGRAAGSITAAWFLAEAVPDEVRWAHLDIAGTAWGEKKPYRAGGATGSGVATMVRIAQEFAGRA